MCFCVFLTWSMTYLNYLMACTVFTHRHLWLNAVAFTLCRSEPSATSGYACQKSPSFTSTIPLHIYCDLHRPHHCLSSTPLCDDDDDVTLAPVSCSDCVYISSVLACCTSVWSPGTMESMLKRECSWGIGQEKGMMGRGLCRLRELWDHCWWQSIYLVPILL